MKELKRLVIVTGQVLSVAAITIISGIVCGFIYVLCSSGRQPELNDEKPQSTLLDDRDIYLETNENSICRK